MSAGDLDLRRPLRTRTSARLRRAFARFGAVCSRHVDLGSAIDVLDKLASMDGHTYASAARLRGDL